MEGNIYTDPSDMPLFLLGIHIDLTNNPKYNSIDGNLSEDGNLSSMSIMNDHFNSSQHENATPHCETGSLSDKKIWSKLLIDVSPVVFVDAHASDS